MTFLQNCIAENELEQALEYIHQICADIDNSRVIRYCENDALNLILSSYAGQASDAGIELQFTVTATDFTRFQITDLCSLFANALENAIYACEKIPAPEKRYITLKVYEKNNRICIQIANSYLQEPVFENEIPISHEPNHGLGTKSMISVVEKYHGVYGFFAEDGKFRFRHHCKQSGLRSFTYFLIYIRNEHATSYSNHNFSNPNAIFFYFLFFSYLGIKTYTQKHF